MSIAAHRKSTTAADASDNHTDTVPLPGKVSSVLNNPNKSVHSCKLWRGVCSVCSALSSAGARPAQPRRPGTSSEQTLTKTHNKKNDCVSEKKNAHHRVVIAGNENAEENYRCMACLTSIWPVTTRQMTAATRRRCDLSATVPVMTSILTTASR